MLKLVEKLKNLITKQGTSVKMFPDKLLKNSPSLVVINCFEIAHIQSS